MENDFHISPSSLKTFCECRLRFHLKYIRRVPIPDAKEVRALSLGKLVHRAIALLTQMIHTPGRGVISPDVLPDVVFQAAKDEGIADSEMIRDAITMLRNWYVYEHLKETPVLVDGETLQYDIAPGVPLIGKPDAIRRSRRLSPSGGTDYVDTIVDYKTGVSRYYPSDVENSPQLLIYALLWRQHLQDNPKRRPPDGSMPRCIIRYEQVTHRTAVQREVNEDDIHQLAEWLRSIAQEMQNGDTTPNPDRHCRFCEYLPMCATGVEYMGRQQPTKPPT
jgi:RecB family exonuclease